MLHNIHWLGFGFVLALVVIRSLATRYLSSLRKFNGPVLASFTNAWRFNYVYWHRHEPPMLKIHEKYGDIVRLGPNVLAFRQPQAVLDIYGPKGRNFRKSEFYPVNSSTTKGRRNFTLFSAPDKLYHDNLRRAVGSAFSVTSVLRYEPFVDSTIGLFLKTINQRFTNKTGAEGVVNFAEWLQYFAFDTIEELTYGARDDGLIESGRDVSEILGYLQDFLSYGYVAGQMPVLDKIFRHNPILIWLNTWGLFLGTTFPGIPFAVKRIQGKLDRQKIITTQVEDPATRESLLDRFLRAKQEHSETVTDREVLGLTLSMIFAGSDTTAITLTALFYYLLKNPECYSRLQREVDENFPTFGVKALEDPVDYTKAQTLPYLHACLQETFRIHPAAGFNNERVVDPQDAIICGERIPGGTIVSCSSWVLHRNKEIFGEDVDSYRPERWLGDSEDVKEMNRAMFQFAQGNFSCIGKNISIMEMTKVVPAILRAFHISLADPDMKLKVFNGQNVRILNLDVRVERRWT